MAFIKVGQRLKNMITMKQSEKILKKTGLGMVDFL